jgi:predicted nucleotidyltransferase
MLTLDTLRSERRDEILRLAARRGAKDVRVFGSVARGEQMKTAILTYW